MPLQHLTMAVDELDIESTARSTASLLHRRPGPVRLECGSGLHACGLQLSTAWALVAVTCGLSAYLYPILNTSITYVFREKRARFECNYLVHSSATSRNAI